jgi:hypothetical protein
MKLICATAALATLIASPVFAACTEPSGPASVPDGNTATLKDMLATQQAIAAYNTATNSYIDCLKKEHDAAIAAAGTDISAKQKDQLDKDEATKQNRAVDQLNSVAGKFNEQVRVFKAKNAAPPPKSDKDKKG